MFWELSFQDYGYPHIDKFGVREKRNDTDEIHLRRLATTLSPALNLWRAGKSEVARTHHGRPGHSPIRKRQARY